MMRICVVGWYGTETLGDRAILDGIISIMSNIDNNLIISIASLYPFLTERTIYEDKGIYNSHGAYVSLETFDVYNESQLHKSIICSDIVMMGGGPITDLTDLYNVQHAFKYAKMQRKKTVLMGCGYGPLRRKEYLKCTREIAKYSDLIIMRSDDCCKKMKELCGSSISKRIFSSVDPAMISVMEFYMNNRNKLQKFNEGSWLLNVRDLDYVYNAKNSMEELLPIIQNISDQINTLELVPMHTFFVGGDDRYIQNRIAKNVHGEVFVNQRPLSLEQMYYKVMQAEGCIGMRYHSIVFHTFLNGNNYLIDYTDRKEGKIRSFLNSFDANGFYKNRYLSVFDKEKRNFNLSAISRYEWQFSLLDEAVSCYTSLLSEWVGCYGN